MAKGSRWGGEDYADGPQGGGDNKTKWGQPNTPIMPPAPTIAMQIGRKGDPISPYDAVKSINPDWNGEYGDYSENCQRCVVAYELNRRGYNVEASEAYGDRDPYPRGKWQNAFEGGRQIDVGGRNTAKVNDNILGNMRQWGNGSRGIVTVVYPRSNSGHAFNVEYSGGKLHYYDAQTGERYNPAKVFDHVSPTKVKVMRSDNLALADDVRNMVRKKRTNRK